MVSNSVAPVPVILKNNNLVKAAILNFDFLCFRNSPKRFGGIRILCTIGSAVLAGWRGVISKDGENTKNTK